MPYFTSRQALIIFIISQKPVLILNFGGFPGDKEYKIVRGIPRGLIGARLLTCVVICQLLNGRALVG